MEAKLLEGCAHGQVPSDLAPFYPHPPTHLKLTERRRKYTGAELPNLGQSPAGRSSSRTSRISSLSASSLSLARASSPIHQTGRSFHLCPLPSTFVHSIFSYR